MQTRRRELFSTIRTEGVLLPPDLLQRIADGDRELEGMSQDAYHLAADERLGEAITRSWNRLVGAWTSFRNALAQLPENDRGTSLTRERWLLILFQELGYGRLLIARAVDIDQRSYPVSHAWGTVPIHLIGARIPIDRRSPGVSGAAGQSPHGLVQELLNRSEGSLWGFVSNGLVFRVLRDNSTLTRQAYLEFNLEAMMDGEVYSDFVVLWLLCHESRVEGDRPEQCWLELWSQQALERGTRALEGLRAGVEEALAALGYGFLAHPQNRPLRGALRTGELTKDDYYRQLLRLVYRLLFLFVAEDRGLLLAPDAPPQVRERYSRFFSTQRLRHLAERRRGRKHGDLYEALGLVMRKLGDDNGCSQLGLPPLGSFLWSTQAVPDVGFAQLANQDLLQAVRALAFIQERGMRRAVDYKNLGSEELGSVYESLLELHPEMNVDAPTFVLRVAAGHERKTTGSYYTPSSLISVILDSSLDPLLDNAVRTNAPEQALLTLNVCDPACGSGHFLVAAAHRIAKRLASVRSGDDEPSPTMARRAVRDVIGSCLYGVDLNPMAVELCKINLWLEALEPGRPLSFLDHRIVCGNALLGATPRLIANGIPDAAFDPIEGDDRNLSHAFRKQNKKEREGRTTTLFAEMSREAPPDYSTLGTDFARVDTIDDSSIEGIHRKETALRLATISPEYARRRFTADAWCASFFAARGAGAPEPITEGFFAGMRDYGRRPAEEISVDIARLSDQYKFFHWHLAFPEVFLPSDNPTFEDQLTGWSGGFDLVIGNPPWERVKLQEEEFFASRAPAVAGAKNAAVRKRMIASLPETDPGLATEWSDAVRVAESESKFFRLSGRYPLGGVGDVNTYAVFADLFRQLTNRQGAAGLLVPNGLVTGFTYRAFLRHLLDTRTLKSFYGFENEDKIFPGVHNETKFGILTITGSLRPVDHPWFTAHLRQPTQVSDPLRRYRLTAEQIRQINPNTLNIPAFRWAADAEVTAAIHEAAPVLVRRNADGAVENPWQITFHRLFDMANDSGLFLDHASIAPDIIERRGCVARLKDGSEVFPLYEGKMLWHFDHRYGTYAGQTQKQANKGVLPHVDDRAHDDPTYRIQPRYWVAADKTRQAIGQDWVGEWFFAFRDVGPTERTLTGAILPITAVGHAAPLISSHHEPRAFAALVGVLLSLVVDYDARQKSSRMTFFVVEQLAVLTPEQLAAEYAWLGGPAQDWLALRVHELCYTNEELAPLALSLGNSLPPFRWIPERRAQIQAEIDAAILHLYGLNRSHAEWLIDSFTVLRKYEEDDYGEFRTRRLLLERYDSIELAIKTNTVYQTPLSPPPGDSRAAHASVSEAGERS